MKVAVLLSGGVDSSVALRLIQQRGLHVEAYYIKIWLEDELAYLGNCPWEEDLEFARAVCMQAGIPLHTVSLQSEYRELVVDRALDELRRGRTPSPDIFCNQRIKFGEFWHHLDGNWDKIATGHYARIEERGDDSLLVRAPDPVKDQTYFLSYLSQDQLKRSLFPIGHLKKVQVRQLAEDLDLPTRSRKDSQGICFLGKINYPDFVSFHLGERVGNIVEAETGRKLGEHRGFWFYTIGQRHGLDLGGGPWFVVEKNTQDNTLFVSHKEDVQNRARSCFFVDDLNWITRAPATDRLQVKIRHSPELEDCRIEPAGENSFAVHLDNPDPGIAPGQHAVFYEGMVCLGGGIIR
jgi:tRNA (5-methylaminomethyl-2-thiouridylate)-methyltransferase